MNSESFPYQKRIRKMGTALAVISFIGLLFWLLFGLAHVFFPSFMLMDADSTYFERLVGEDAPDPKVATDTEMRAHFETRFPEVQSELLEGITKEIYISTMLYFTKLREGEVIEGFMLPDMSSIDDDELSHFEMLSGGMTEDSTIRELIFKDRAFFQAHKGTYQLLVIVTAAFFSVMSLVILRMALSWRQGDPFGLGTIRGLRWLGVLFLVQFLAGWGIGLSAFLVPLPYSGFDIDFTFYSSTVDDSLTELLTGGGGLSSAIVFLILSWVLEYGRKMKEEQALTI